MTDLESGLMPRKNGLTAYHNDPAVKLKYVGRIRAHLEADELVHGTYWRRGKGCAIGCTIHSADHDKYETELGMPEWFAHLEDRIFEGMSVAASRQFPLDLLSAIPVGFAKWDDLYHAFCIFLLRDVCRLDRTKHPDAAAAVDAIIRLHEKWTETDNQAWAAARAAAWSAAPKARSVTEARTAMAMAVESARSSAVTTTRVATTAAGVTEARTAMAMAVAMESARSSAVTTTRVATTAAGAAESTAYDRMGDWLVRRFNWEDTS